MAGLDREIVTFARSELDRLVVVCEDLAGSGTGEGWVNIGPALSDEQAARVPVRSSLAAWFSGRGPVVPLATWTPPVPGPRGRPVVIGLAHGRGPDALDRLASSGVPLPPGWRRRQDHAKHGVVVEVAPSVPVSEVLGWLLDALEVLNPLGPAPGWYAEIRRPST